MILWTTFTDFLSGLFSNMSGLLGGNMGLAILGVSLAVRFALLPLSLKLARKGIERQHKLKLLQPRLEELKKRHRENPQRLTEETFALYRKHDLKLVDKAGLLGGLAQAPVFIGMFSAIRSVISSGQRFLWIGDLARPDLLLTLCAAGLTYAATAVTPMAPGQARGMMTFLPVILTLVFLWQLSAGIGLYWVASSVVSVVQSLLLRNRRQDPVGA